MSHVERLVSRKPWLMYALLTTAFWGVWGAYAGLPTQHGFPETLVYVVWALTMIPPALYAWQRVGWKFQADGRSVYLGLMIGAARRGRPDAAVPRRPRGPDVSDLPDHRALPGGDHRAFAAAAGRARDAGLARSALCWRCWRCRPSTTRRAARPTRTASPGSCMR